VSKRGVALQEFRDFLKAVPEWNPKNWPGAPESYHLFVTDVEKSTAEESKPLSLENIPLKVAQVFVAWKNMFREYEAIMDLKPSWSQMDSFLSKAPFYERSKWRNFYSHYIVSSLKKVEKKEHIPKEEIPFFLRAALFNDLKETKAKEASA
jgi:hypothetical protein